MEVIIRENGDITIPQTIIANTNFKPGQKVIITIESGKIVISPDKGEILERLRQLSKNNYITHIDSDEIHEQMILERFKTI
ncbi:MAG TPA: AbrB/MazE/SpoVT family DNA-binding domain-containing protein [Methanospirillum sp.]|uniref:AbrB/MazE/SpoVT family DNA-binding domain-containing protein n=1 Tax=Methanospirillum sp. TaxID=45200 RepID=UPI002C3F073A|nr:AbrB/MazE/SpoVT family DNA-binding domain-containing protein [Methanospirillum sp.]HOJ97829.1 AbrB/MazE/SpoVT family DNA-binding domain-containing protein [Methanospirillum sp.]HPP78841.1 AbrB/MazE/SpoVT family DNA-binding domain-containing protein [Methanospirillum sp.]